MEKYGKLSPETAEKLRAIVGTERFFMGGDINPNYSHDEMPIYGSHMPEAVCEVESTREVSEILKLCNEHRIPVTPRGGGHRPCGGRCAPAGRCGHLHGKNE